MYIRTPSILPDEGPEDVDLYHPVTRRRRNVECRIHPCTFPSEVNQCHQCRVPNTHRTNECLQSHTVKPPLHRLFIWKHIIQNLAWIHKIWVVWRCDILTQFELHRPCRILLPWNPTDKRTSVSHQNPTLEKDLIPNAPRKQIRRPSTQKPCGALRNCETVFFPPEYTLKARSRAKGTQDLVTDTKPF